MEPLTLSRKQKILFLAGANLIIIQFVMIRNFASLLFGTEMIILLTTLSYFFGVSLGYLISDRVPKAFLETASVLTLALHLTLPFSLRFLSGALLSLDHKLFVLLSLIFIGSFLISSFYSLLLPRFIEEEGQDSLTGLYQYEILGALAGVLLLFICSNFAHGNLVLMAGYFLALSAILNLQWRSKALLANCLVLTAAYLVLSPRLEAASVAYYYQQAAGIDRKSEPEIHEVIRTLYSRDTPYQRIEITEGLFSRRQLYLDGIRHFGDDALSDFNMFITGLPASFFKDPSVLIVGSGSMGSLYQVLGQAKTIDTVEIDRQVISAGLEFLRNDHDRTLDPLIEQKWTLNIDDAKHFLNNTQKKYDLIAMDIAGPLQMQVALLYTKEFYETVRAKLTDNGILSVSLNGQMWKNGTVTMRILQTLKSVFGDLVVIAPYEDSNFCYASKKFPFTKTELEKKLAERKSFKTRVLDKAEIESALAAGDYPLITRKKMDLVLHRTWKRLMTQYFSRDD